MAWAMRSSSRTPVGKVRERIMRRDGDSAADWRPRDPGAVHDVFLEPPDLVLERADRFSHLRGRAPFGALQDLDRFRGPCAAPAACRSGEALHDFGPVVVGVREQMTTWTSESTAIGARWSRARPIRAACACDDRHRVGASVATACAAMASASCPWCASRSRSPGAMGDGDAASPKHVRLENVERCLPKRSACTPRAPCEIT